MKRRTAIVDRSTELKATTAALPGDRRRRVFLWVIGALVLVRCRYGWVKDLEGASNVVRQ